MCFFRALFFRALFFALFFFADRSFLAIFYPCG